MQQLPNGLFRISNATTGQTLDVKPQDLPQYGLQAPGGQGNGQGINLGSILEMLRGIGGGAVQDIAAPAYLAGQEITHGQSPIAGVGNQPNLSQLQQYAQSNPLSTQQQLEKMGGTPVQAAGQGGQDLLGALSWLLPGVDAVRGAQAAAKLAPLAKPAVGAVQGGLQGASQPGATPGSVASSAGISALLNTILPGGGGKAATVADQAAHEGTDAFAKVGTNAAKVAAAAHEHTTNTTNALYDWLEHLQPIAQHNEEQLQTALQNVKEPIDAGDIMEKLRGIAEGNGYTFTLSGKGAGDRSIDPVLQKVRTILDPQGSLTPSATLADVNQAKRALADNYTKGPVYQPMYHYLQNYIEQASGVPDTIKQLNRQAHVTGMQASALRDAINTTPAQVVKQGMNDLQIGNEGHAHSVAHALQTVGKIIGLAVPGDHKFLNYAIGGDVGKQLGTAGDTPLARQRMQEVGNKAQGAVSGLAGVMRQLGVRIPAAVGSAPLRTPGK